MTGRRPSGIATFVAGALSLVQLSAGCSAVAVRGPPEGPQPSPPPPVECTTSKFLPIADGVVASLLVLETGAQIVADQQRGGGSSYTLGLLGVSAVALFIISSGVGMERVDACREAKQKELNRRERLLRTRPIAPASPAPIAQPPEPPPATPSPEAPRAPQQADPD